MDCKEVLINWLNNAYAMENAMVDTLEAHVGDLKDMGDNEEQISKLEEHINQTESQAERVSSEIERLGGDIKDVKSGLAEMGAKAMGVMSDMAHDKVIKNMISDHAAEHFEMATYMSIAKAADLCGETETARVAREIMEEETAMAEEIEQDMDIAVEKYLEMAKEKE